MYTFLKNFLTPFIKFFFNIKITGLENIPESGGVILAANHASNWDALILAVSMKRDVVFMGKAELFSGKILNVFFTALNVIPVNRGENDIKALKSSLRALKNENVLGIFPEGTRCSPDKRHEVKSGVSLIASKSSKPLIPVSIKSTYKIFKPTEVIFHKPVYVTNTDYESESMRIMDIIYS